MTCRTPETFEDLMRRARRFIDRRPVELPRPKPWASEQVPRPTPWASEQVPRPKPWAAEHCDCGRRREHDEGGR